jgi:hypothetical protein
MAVGRHNKRTGHMVTIVIRSNGQKVSWKEPALGPEGRRGSIDSKGRDVHVAQSGTYMVGSNA